MGELEGKVAVVTGASSGIGMATALVFAREGAKVIVADVMPDGGEKTVKAITDIGGKACFVKCDVSQSDQIKAMVDKTIQTYGSLDFAVNNAFIQGDPKLLADSSEETWDRVMAVDLKGVWLCMKYEILHMLKTGHGVIVNVSSTAGLSYEGALALYVVAKHGVMGLTKAAAAQYGRMGIRVNAICPGITKTPGWYDFEKAVPAEEVKRCIDRIPMGFLAEPEQIAEPIVWLCTDGAGYVNGATIVVDGGALIV